MNVLRGGGGNDILFGRGGADRFNGGDGADQFIYEFASDGGDRIRQFAVGSDKIVIVSENFAGIDADTIAAALNVNGSGNAASAGPKFTFDNSGAGAGILSYDADGTGAGAKVTLATIRFDSEFGLSLFSAADFMFV